MPAKPPFSLAMFWPTELFWFVSLLLVLGLGGGMCWHDHLSGRCYLPATLSLSFWGLLCAVRCDEMRRGQNLLCGVRRLPIRSVAGHQPLDTSFRSAPACPPHLVDQRKMRPPDRQRREHGILARDRRILKPFPPFVPHTPYHPAHSP